MHTFECLPLVIPTDICLLSNYRTIFSLYICRKDVFDCDSKCIAYSEIAEVGSAFPYSLFHVVILSFNET